jgi:hypothetical protein
MCIAIGNKSYIRHVLLYLTYMHAPATELLQVALMLMHA